MTFLNTNRFPLLLGSAVITALSSLAVFQAPAKPLWYLAIAVTEWGYWFAWGPLLALFFIPWKTWHGRWVGSLLAIAILFFVSPLWRAQAVAAGLPEALKIAFGPSTPRSRPHAPARSGPLSWQDLWFGISSPPVEKTTHVYSTSQGQTLSLDLYKPIRPLGPLPGLLIVHGGSWQSGDRSDFEAFNRYFAARGYAVAVIDYRLAPRWTYPAARNDVYAALNWLTAHSKELQVEKDHWVLLGRSAGGEIALSAAYGVTDPRIRGVVVMYAPNDLAYAYSIPANPLIMNSQKVIETYMGGTPAELPALYQIASPLNFVNRQTPPTLMIHGLRDELVWPVHEFRLSAKLKQAGRPYYFLQLPWATHACDIHLAGPSGQLSLYAIERFLAVVMPPILEEEAYV